MINTIKNHRNILFAALLIAEISLMVYMTWQYGAQWLDSDDSAEMILAELLSREGGILSKSWYYSTELRVLNTQLVMAPLFFRSEGLVTKSFFNRSLCAVIAASAGLAANNIILTKSYSFVKITSTHLVPPQWGKLFAIIKSIPAFLGSVKPDIASPSIIVVILVVILCLVIGCMGLRLFRHWKSLSQETQILLAFFLFSFLITVFGPVFSTQTWSRRYMIFPGIGFLVVIAAYMEQFKPTGSLKKFLCIFILIAELFAGINQCLTFAHNRELPEKNAAFTYILNSGMKFGFGDWDTSDVLTELSNGRIHLCKILNFKRMDVWYWLMEKDFQKYAKGEPVFLIIANERFTYNGGVPHVLGSWVESDLSYLDAGKRVFRDQHYTVWRYESYEQFEALVGKKF